MSSSSTRKNRPPEPNAPDLFSAPEVPKGFGYTGEVISIAEERRLVRRFEKLDLQPFEFQGHLAHRRIFTFGHRYIFAGQKPRANSRIPDYFWPLMQIAGQISEKPPEMFEQIMVTEYARGAGIGWHRDRPLYRDIVSVSFLAPCALRLRRKRGDAWERRSALIEPRSAYLLQGSVREDWQHSITPQEALRYSVTLRTFHSGKGRTECEGAAESGRLLVRSPEQCTLVEEFPAPDELAGQTMPGQFDPRGIYVTSSDSMLKRL
jgi:2-oxoglutarate-Fe(II)-dependent oxygenase superfamily protein